MSPASRRYLARVALALSTSLGAVAIAGATAALSAGVAGASNDAWSIQSTPNPSGVTAPGLNSVSCVGSTCIAVGSGDGSTKALPLSEYWNGSTWSVETATDPGLEGSLLGVSCASSTWCLGVGWDESPTTYDQDALADVWTGSSWTNLGQQPPGTEVYVSGASCADYNYLVYHMIVTLPGCTVVGSQINSGAPLVETYKEDAWQTVTVPLPSGALGGSLDGVSCTAITTCVAGGLYETSSGGTQPLVEVETAGVWQALTGPAESNPSQIYSVSCTSSSDCVAVGMADGLPLVEQWNGSTLTSIAVPSSFGTGWLYSVSCYTSYVWGCQAVGTTFNQPVSLAIGTSGVTAEGTPGSDELNGVSCVQSTGCEAVGYNGTGTMADDLLPVT